VVTDDMYDCDGDREADVTCWAPKAGESGYVLGFYKIYGKFTSQIFTIPYGYYFRGKHDTSDNRLY
jgi:hypothetical protein